MASFLANADIASWLWFLADGDCFGGYLFGKKAGAGNGAVGYNHGTDLLPLQMSGNQFDRFPCSD